MMRRSDRETYERDPFLKGKGDNSGFVEEIALVLHHVAVFRNVSFDIASKVMTIEDIASVIKVFTIEGGNRMEIDLLEEFGDVCLLHCSKGMPQRTKRTTER